MVESSFLIFKREDQLVLVIAKLIPMNSNKNVVNHLFYFNCQNKYKFLQFLENNEGIVIFNKDTMNSLKEN